MIKQSLAICLMLILLAGCNSEMSVEDIEEKATFPLWLPTYIPEGFSIEKVSASEDRVFIYYKNGEQYIEVLEKKNGELSFRRKVGRYMKEGENREPLLEEFYENGPFIGTIDKSAKNNFGVYKFTFIQREYVWEREHHYSLQTNVDEETFEKIVESLE